MSNRLDQEKAEMLQIAEQFQQESHETIEKILFQKGMENVSIEDATKVFLYKKLAAYELRLRKIESHMEQNNNTPEELKNLASNAKRILFGRTDIGDEKKWLDPNYLKERYEAMGKVDEFMNYTTENYEAICKIRDYCQRHNISPEDLINAHRILENFAFD